MALRNMWEEAVRVSTEIGFEIDFDAIELGLLEPKGGNESKNGSDGGGDIGELVVKGCRDSLPEH